MLLKYEDFENPDFIKPDTKIIDFVFIAWLIVPLTFFIAGMIALAIFLGKRLLYGI